MSKTIAECTPAERLQRGRELIRAARVEIGILEDVRAELQDDLKRIEARIEAHRAGLKQLEGAAGLLAAQVERAPAAGRYPESGAQTLEFIQRVFGPSGTDGSPQP